MQNTLVSIINPPVLTCLYMSESNFFVCILTWGGFKAPPPTPHRAICAAALMMICADDTAARGPDPEPRVWCGKDFERPSPRSSVSTFTNRLSLAALTSDAFYSSQVRGGAKVGS